MTQKHRMIIRRYFRDWVKWLALVTLAFALSMIAFIFADNDGFLWAIPSIFVALFLSSMGSLLLFIKVASDIRKKAVRRTTVCISALMPDKRYSFIRSGSPGGAKYRLTDKNGESFLLSASEDGTYFPGFSPDPDFDIVVEYLESSKLVIGMTLPAKRASSKAALEQGENMLRFRQFFNIYIS